MMTAMAVTDVTKSDAVNSFSEQNHYSIYSMRSVRDVSLLT